ncbi:hypothetical protein BH11ACT1_BH11ACT1_32540 [soil metagenome]
MVAEPRRTPVSIVCVFNDLDVRTACLDRSIRAGMADAPQTEYIPIDNRHGHFASAGAALNDGARRARHGVVVFVHQDVYLHSLVALETAAAALQDDPQAGLVGAVGITASGTVAGVVRDRVVIIGEPSSPSVTVDSVDEVLFMIERDRALKEPISEHPDLAWHAYAVEYGARVRDQGLHVMTHDVVLTHNSMTTNLVRLTEAHQHVARSHPDTLPLRTTCGVIRKPADAGRLRTAFRRRRGVATWLRESIIARRLAHVSGRRVRDVVLAEIRLMIDDALDLVGATGLDVVNLGVSPQEATSWAVDSLPRRGRDMSAAAVGIDDLVPLLSRAVPGGRAVLITGVDDRGLSRVGPALRNVPHVVGLARDTGAWILCCPVTVDLGAVWPARRNMPFGLRLRSGAPSRAAAAASAPAAT